jgi:hypothetical protein
MFSYHGPGRVLGVGFGNRFGLRADNRQRIAGGLCADERQRIASEEDMRQGSRTRRAGRLTYEHGSGRQVVQPLRASTIDPCSTSRLTLLFAGSVLSFLGQGANAIVLGGEHVHKKL